jgi:hypothetical protein
MKFLFKSIQDRLKSEVPELRWIDMDKGQLDYFERPPVSFPCALISVQLPRTVDLGAKKQKCDALIVIRLGFDFSGNTSHVTPETALEKSLEYFDLVEKVYEALQGYQESTYNNLSRQSLREEKRPDMIKVVNIPFITSFVDFRANP